MAHPLPSSFSLLVPSLVCCCVVIVMWWQYRVVVVMWVMADGEFRSHVVVWYVTIHMYVLCNVNRDMSQLIEVVTTWLSVVLT